MFLHRNFMIFYMLNVFKMGQHITLLYSVFLKEKYQLHTAKQNIEPSYIIINKLLTYKNTNKKL